MKRNPDIIYGDFIFDENKNRSNIKKHKGVSLYEGAEVFDDPFVLTFRDPDHSAEENRLLAIGESGQGRLLVVSFIERSRTRLISARKAEPKERRKYVKAHR